MPSERSAPSIRRLTPDFTAAYRAMMLPAYADEPHVFTATAGERESLPLEWWASRLSDQPAANELVLGAFVDAQLVGVAGLRFERRERTRHKATLFALYVGRKFRRQGRARALVEAVLAHARATPDTSVVQLEVHESNGPAIGLYESCGFVTFGVEPRAVAYGDRFEAKVHMSRTV